MPQPAPFRIGEVQAKRAPTGDLDDAGPDEDDEVPEPFAGELGAAAGDTDGFVLSALRTVKGQSHALIALLDAHAGAGQLIDLGPVHGDPEPPAFAAVGKDLLLAAPDTDAGGAMLKLGLLRDARGQAELVWGTEISGVRRDSTFALSSSGDRAFLAYAAESAGKTRVFGALLDPKNPKQKVAAEPFSALGADVDAPRLAPRKGGYWLAVARTLDVAKKPTAHNSDSSTGLDEGDSLLDLGTRRIEVCKLDLQGKLVSSALVVTAAGARPISFDLAGTADGGAYVAFRADDSTPGADGGALELVRVKPDGSFDKVPLTGELDGTGTPSLLVDAADPSALWLTAAGENGATWFGTDRRAQPARGRCFRARRRSDRRAWRAAAASAQPRHRGRLERRAMRGVAARVAEPTHFSAASGRARCPARRILQTSRCPAWTINSRPAFWP